jgi:hypothetical protein
MLPSCSPVAYSVEPSGLTVTPYTSVSWELVSGHEYVGKTEEPPTDGPALAHCPGESAPVAGSTSMLAIELVCGLATYSCSPSGAIVRSCGRPMPVSRLPAQLVSSG